MRETRENAFTIESTVTTSAAPAEVYRALGTVSEWWDPEHTWSGSAKNLSLQLQAGGCFCEQLADGGSIQHGRVIYAQPGVMLRLDTPLGPLQEMPVTGVLTFKLAPEGAGTRITMTYRVAGAFTMESAKLAPIVDQRHGRAARTTQGAWRRAQAAEVGWRRGRKTCRSAKRRAIARAGMHFSGVFALLAQAPALAQAPDLSKVEFRTEKLGDNLFVLFGGGGNIAVLNGPDGALVVDSDLVELSPKLRAALTMLSEQPARFLINTHFHFDHAGGNAVAGSRRHGHRGARQCAQTPHDPAGGRRRREDRHRADGALKACRWSPSRTA